MELYEELEQTRQEQMRHQQNAARLAQASGEFESTGLGSYFYEDRIEFGLTFVDKPYIAYGSEIDLDELKQLLDDKFEISDDDDVPFPNASGFVIEWDTDDRGFYVGAWVAVTVTIDWTTYGDGTTAWASIPIVVGHHFTFTAVGLKDVTDEAPGN